MLAESSAARKNTWWSCITPLPWKAYRFGYLCLWKFSFFSSYYFPWLGLLCWLLISVVSLHKLFYVNSEFHRFLHRVWAQLYYRQAFMAFKCMTGQSTCSILAPYIHPPFQLFQMYDLPYKTIFSNQSPRPQEKKERTRIANVISFSRNNIKLLNKFLNSFIIDSAKKLKGKLKLKTAPCDLCHNVSSFAKICRDQRTWRTSFKNFIYWIHFISLNFLFQSLFFLSIFAFPDWLPGTD